MKWILIIIGLQLSDGIEMPKAYSAFSLTVEFDDQGACEAARETIAGAIPEGNANRAGLNFAMCFPKST